MERRVRGNPHARCGAGEKAETISKPYLSLYIETEVRPYAIQYVRHKYGAQSVSGIMNRGTQAGKAAINTAARIYGLQKANDSGAYMSDAAQLSAKAVELSDDENHVSLRKIKDELEKYFTGYRNIREILRYALLIENSMTQIGQHAAGIIITDGNPVDDYVPLIYNAKNDIMTTQCDMTQAEEIGLLKIDFLGLMNLTVITETLREIKKNYGVSIDMDRIPYDDADVYREIYSKAMTNSVFQFESDGMKKMLREFKPESIFDLILLVAMFRPGPLQYLPDVIAVKNGKKKAEYLTPELEPILKPTYGSVTYQEQVQEIFKSLAGYSFGQADLVRRAMSKKKEKVLLAERESFLHGDASRGIPGCVANGIDEDAANRLFDQLTDFAKYAFNKSHAACYAVVSYQTAWLKYHYPHEYMKAVLNHTPFEKYAGLVSDLHAMGIEVLPPDINRSEMDFTVSDKRILFGFRSIKGLGKTVEPVIRERKANGPYRSISDFVARTNPGKEVLEGFTDAGVFDCFCKNREAVRGLIPEYLKLVKKAKDNEKKRKEEYDRKRSENLRMKAEAIRSQILSLKPDPVICRNERYDLGREKEILGAYVSGHPLDLYESPEKSGAVSIRGAVSGNAGEKISLIGMITDLRVRLRKNDNAEMGFFELMDKSGTIEACCFAKQYARLKDKIKEDDVVRADGKISSDRNDPSKLNFIVEDISPVEPVRQPITIYVNGVYRLEEGLWNVIKPYVSENGNPLRIYDSMMDEYRMCALSVSPAILSDGRVRAALG